MRIMQSQIFACFKNDHDVNDDGYDNYFDDYDDDRRMMRTRTRLARRAASRLRWLTPASLRPVEPQASEVNTCC